MTEAVWKACLCGLAGRAGGRWGKQPESPKPQHGHLCTPHPTHFNTHSLQVQAACQAQHSAPAPNPAVAPSDPTPHPHTGALLLLRASNKQMFPPLPALLWLPGNPHPAGSPCGVPGDSPAVLLFPKAHSGAVGGGDPQVHGWVPTRPRREPHLVASTSAFPAERGGAGSRLREHSPRSREEWGQIGGSVRGPGCWDQPGPGGGGSLAGQAGACGSRWGRGLGVPGGCTAQAKRLNRDTWWGAGGQPGLLGSTDSPRKVNLYFYRGGYTTFNA